MTMEKTTAENTFEAVKECDKIVSTMKTPIKAKSTVHTKTYTNTQDITVKQLIDSIAFGISEAVKHSSGKFSRYINRTRGSYFKVMHNKGENISAKNAEYKISFIATSDKTIDVQVNVTVHSGKSYTFGFICR